MKFTSLGPTGAGGCTLTVTGEYALPAGAVFVPFSVIVIGSTVTPPPPPACCPIA